MCDRSGIVVTYQIRPGYSVSFVYQTHSFVIDPNHYTIEGPQGIVKARPKTFSLLVLMLEHPREVLSKNFLLETIWDDVAVGEQVLFQSIGEIRKLFQQPSIIKTHPRKGYSWVADVERVDIALVGAEQKAATLCEPDLKDLNLKEYIPNDDGVITKRPAGLRMRGLAMSAFFITALVITAFFFNQTAPPITGTVIILPVKNTIAGNGHNWVTLGAMDQLIKQVAFTGDTVVMEPLFVLGSMKNAGLTHDYASDDVSRIFDVTGASLLVETELSGSIEDYRLSYKLHLKSTLKFGVIIEQKLDLALEQLAVIIAREVGNDARPVSQHFRSEFNNALMARALEEKRLGNLKTASELLASLIGLERHNITAHRLLGVILIQRGEFDAAQTILKQGIQRMGLGERAERGEKEHAKLLYWVASAQTAQGWDKLSLRTLGEAEIFAAESRDWLYRAYIAQLQGRNYRQLAQFTRAENALEHALEYHAVIHCPIGTAGTQLQFARLFALQGQEEAAGNALNNATKLIKTRQLLVLTAMLEEARREIFPL